MVLAHSSRNLWSCSWNGICCRQRSAMVGSHCLLDIRNIVHTCCWHGKSLDDMYPCVSLTERNCHIAKLYRRLCPEYRESGSDRGWCCHSRKACRQHVLHTLRLEHRHTISGPPRRSQARSVHQDPTPGHVLRSISRYRNCKHTALRKHFAMTYTYHRVPC